MSTTFHILDAISQDVDGETLINNGYGSDEDPEVMRIKKKKAAEDSYKNPGKLAMNIFLFGKTAEGVPVRACVEGFEPFFYVRLPDYGQPIRSQFEGALRKFLKPMLVF